jgi:integrase
MNAKSYEAEKTVKNEIKGTLKGHSALVSPFPTPIDYAPKINRAAKSSVDYWKERVRPRTLKDGSITPELYLRIKQGGRDAWFNLDTANRVEAARKARDLWMKVRSNGLTEVLAENRPDARPARSATVGELLSAAKSVSTVRPSTLAQYEISLRRLVAGVLGITPTGSVFYHGSDESKAWREKIERVSLDVLTDAKVEAWRKAYIDSAPNEIARISHKNTSSGVIRNARSLLGPNFVKAIGQSIRLPSPLPLVGLSIGSSTRRFNTAVDPRKLYATARSQLSGDVLAAFLLCLVGGLRRGEADMLPWTNVDLDNGIVHVLPTKWFLPKTEESQRSTPITPEVADWLRRHQADAPEAEFVLAGLSPDKKRGAKEYRCFCWKKLGAWLRTQDFTSPNPIHELRKLSGSFVNQADGLEAARRHLGHKNVATTSASYIQARTVTVDLS